jgi:hypothetical protein
MIDMQQFEHIKEKQGSYASWAVWADASGNPKSNMGDVSHFENENVLSFLKNNIVMVGLNISGRVSESFTNFHSPTEVRMISRFDTLLRIRRTTEPT